MKIVFFGSGAFGLPTLRHLFERHEVLCVVSQPDKPAGRGGTLTPTPIAQFAAEHPGVPLLRPTSINEPGTLRAVRDFPADAWVVIAYGQKLSKPLLDGRFAVNLHASLLPRWRGAAPINAAILAGDEITGNSVITLAEKMDAGLVLGQSQRPILPDQTAGMLHDLLAADGPALVEQVLAAHVAGTLHAQEQGASLVTIAPKLSKADGWVDFSEPGPRCARRINGLSPWPGVAVKFRGEALKLVRATTADAAVPKNAPPGAIVDADAGVVACAGGTAIRLLDVQPPGKPVMAWRAFANGRRLSGPPGATAEVLIGGRPS